MESPDASDVANFIRRIQVCTLSVSQTPAISGVISMAPMISAQDLHQDLNSSWRVFDASWYLSAQGRDADREYAEAHIPGAVRFDFDGAIAQRESSLPHMLPPVAELQGHLRDLGLNNDTRVVVYDGAGLFAAPRAWWMLKTAGLENVFVLNGGLPAWRAAGFALSDATPPVPSAGRCNVSLVARWLASCDDVQRALTENSAIVLDARPAERFHGRAPEPRAGLRSGHMPGAINLPTDALVSEGFLLPESELVAIFDNIGPPDEPLICSCGSGVTAAIIALAATVAGRHRVAVYDGSWAEWGQPGPLDVVCD
jgi:thiosulfate/3-mercaptopyruvate sulfurtransferase